MEHLGVRRHARPLADDALGGAVSPDGEHIAFRRPELNYYDGLVGREIWAMRSDGTDQVKIATDKRWSRERRRGLPTGNESPTSVK